MQAFFRAAICARCTLPLARRWKNMPFPGGKGLMEIRIKGELITNSSKFVLIGVTF
jgi:hypothetical protein